MATSKDIVRHEARIDAGQVAGEGPFALSTTVIAAPGLLKSASPVILVCWPGGGVTGTSSLLV